jgi:hypothetical protein
MALTGAVMMEGAALMAALQVGEKDQGHLTSKFYQFSNSNFLLYYFISWNWTSMIAKKKFYNSMLLSGFLGFDGNFK